jgi:putative two-component system response regulator
LAGEDIPLFGRIVAIADVFDTLTSKRPYKEAFSLDKAFGITREGQGRHFDPNVVDPFFAVQERIVRIRETYPDRQESPFVMLAEKAKRF